MPSSQSFNDRGLLSGRKTLHPLKSWGVHHSCDHPIQEEQELQSLFQHGSAHRHLKVTAGPSGWRMQEMDGRELPGSVLSQFQLHVRHSDKQPQDDRHFLCFTAEAKLAICSHRKREEQSRPSHRFSLQETWNNLLPPTSASGDDERRHDRLWKDSAKN